MSRRQEILKRVQAEREYQITRWGHDGHNRNNKDTLLLVGVLSMYIGKLVKTLVQNKTIEYGHAERLRKTGPQGDLLISHKTIAPQGDLYETRYNHYRRCVRHRCIQIAAIAVTIAERYVEEGDTINE